ncbi:hypothetical protein PoB_005539800 [Plakobranchus ocellatus]|uniref:Uncharacterized protein n=1 Tax=Plakobranchus ocellatus TaxID=259542 RepID=A0AAV4CBM8_9GAST|nr:hypothetical protein PoB_005539800 [Plakobranchus ocellatus]
MVVEIGNISSSRTNQPQRVARTVFLQRSVQSVTHSSKDSASVQLRPNLPLSRGLTNQSQGTHSHSNNNFKTGSQINHVKHNPTPSTLNTQLCPDKLTSQLH